MAHYAIGDLQGCYQELLALLRLVEFEPGTDTLFLVGDLVNRGPDSLSVLQWVYDNQEHVRIVLGNHDLHLLAVHAGLARLKRGDTLDALLAAPDGEVLLDWLRRQPLVRSEQGHVFVHAGLLPAWSVADALAYSAEVRAVLASDEYREFLREMYGNEPSVWLQALSGTERLRLIVNVCTRMRMVHDAHRPDFGFKGELIQAPSGLRAWFDVPALTPRDMPVVCGHWSALGLVRRADVIALDTGCVWGGALTAIRLEDGAVFQVPSQQAKQTEWAN